MFPKVAEISAQKKRQLLRTCSQKLPKTATFWPTTFRAPPCMGNSTENLRKKMHQKWQSLKTINFSIPIHVSACCTEQTLDDKQIRQRYVNNLCKKWSWYSEIPFHHRKIAPISLKQSKWVLRSNSLDRVKITIIVVCSRNMPYLI